MNNSNKFLRFKISKIFLNCFLGFTLFASLIMMFEAEFTRNMNQYLTAGAKQEYIKSISGLVISVIGLAVLNRKSKK